MLTNLKAKYFFTTRNNKVPLNGIGPKYPEISRLPKNWILDTEFSESELWQTGSSDAGF